MNYLYLEEFFYAGKIDCEIFPTSTKRWFPKNYGVVSEWDKNCPSKIKQYWSNGDLIEFKRTFYGFDYSVCFKVYSKTFEFSIGLFTLIMGTMLT